MEWCTGIYEMKAISLALGTFVLWIVAKGRFGLYKGLITGDASNAPDTSGAASGSGSNSPLPPLPEIPPIGPFPGTDSSGHMRNG